MEIEIEVPRSCLPDLTALVFSPLLTSPLQCWGRPGVKCNYANHRRLPMRRTKPQATTMLSNIGEGGGCKGSLALEAKSEMTLVGKSKPLGDQQSTLPRHFDFYFHLRYPRKRLLSSQNMSPNKCMYIFMIDGFIESRILQGTVSFETSILEPSNCKAKQIVQARTAPSLKSEKAEASDRRLMLVFPSQEQTMEDLSTTQAAPPKLPQSQLSGAISPTARTRPASRRAESSNRGRAANLVATHMAPFILGRYPSKSH